MDDDAQNAALEQQDADEWDKVLDDFSADKGIETTQGGDEDEAKKKADADADAEAAKKAEDEEAAAKARENETEEEKSAREKREAEENETDEEKAAREEREAKQAEEARERAQARREAREAQRDIIADTEAMREDIINEMFKDVDGKLYDADGDEIKSYEDVMLLRNPATGQNFTEEEAAAWFLKASQHVKQQQIEAWTKAAEYAEVNINIKEEADIIKDKYGEFLSDPANEALRDEILADYFETLVKDPETDIIIKAPVSMIRFYDRALKPYIDAQSQITSAQQAKAEAEKAAKEAEEAKNRAQARGDREDIFARGDNGRSQVSQEDEEWDKVTKEYYAGR